MRYQATSCAGCATTDRRQPCLGSDVKTLNNKPSLSAHTPKRAEPTTTGRFIEVFRDLKVQRISHSENLRASVAFAVT